MTSAPVERTGYSRRSNFTNQTSPAPSRMVKPGVMPCDLPEITVQAADGPVARGGAAHELLDR